MSRRVLVTGADGYVGRRTAARLLTDTDDQLTLAVRAADRAELAVKAGRLTAALPAFEPSRVEIVVADLTGDAPFAGCRTDVAAVVHAAARTDFDLPQPTARSINAEGSLRAAEYAATCPGLERFVLVSTLFSVGVRTGAVPEEMVDTDPAGYANHYEWSKAEAERLLADRYDDLPLTIARLSTVVADDDGGQVTQYNAFHNTLRLFFYGLATVMPGSPDTRLCLTTADTTARALVHLSTPAAAPGVYHLSPGPDDAVPLAEVVSAAFEVFECDPAFVRRGLQRPEFCDLETFRFLVDSMRQLSASPASSALRSVAPFAAEMFAPKEFATARMTESWPQATEFARDDLVRKVCEDLVGTRWGRTRAAV